MAISRENFLKISFAVLHIRSYIYTYMYVHVDAGDKSKSR